MIQDDTVKLLRECNAGVKMAVSSIDEMLPKAKDDNLRHLLVSSKQHHEILGNDTREFLNKYKDEGKELNIIAKSMSWLKTNTKIAMDNNDEAISDLVTDGCNMGVKSLSRYLNKYKAADEKSKDITKKLIKIEEKLAVDLRSYL